MWRNSKEAFEEIPDSVSHLGYFKRVVRRIFSINGVIINIYIYIVHFNYDIIECIHNSVLSL